MQGWGVQWVGLWLGWGVGLRGVDVRTVCLWGMTRRDGTGVGGVEAAGRRV